MKISLQLITFPFWLSFNSSISQAINYLIKDGFHWNWKKENFSPNNIERYLSYWRKSWTLRMASTIKKGSWAVRSTVLFESFWNSSELTANFPQFFLNILSVRFFTGLWWAWIHKVQTSKTLDFRWQGDVKAIVCALLRCLQQIGKGIIPIRNKCAATLLQRGFKGGIIRVVRENSVRGRIYENRQRWRPNFFPLCSRTFPRFIGKLLMTWQAASGITSCRGIFTLLGTHDEITSHSTDNSDIDLSMPHVFQKKRRNLRWTTKIPSTRSI